MNINEVNWNDVLYIDDWVLRWKKPISRKIKYGDLAGHKTKSGYYSLMYMKKNFLAHRVIWCMINGSIPEDKEIDHIDHNGLNNNIKNLRLVDRTGNVRNFGKNLKNTSGVMGVSLDSSRMKWAAYIWDKNKKVFIGRFDKKDDAIEARIKKQVELGYHEMHGSDMVTK